MICIYMHCSRGLGGKRSFVKVPLRVESERPLDKGTEWVVGRLTEAVDSSPLTESMAMGSWAAAVLTEPVNFTLY